MSFVRQLKFPAMPLSSDDVTRLLAEYRDGDRDAIDRLIPIVYAELRRIAARSLRSERKEHTLQPTALVNEVYLRLAEQQNPPWQNRAHFLGCAARLMRHVLVDHARAHQADKRGGRHLRVTLGEDVAWAEEREVDLLALDAALDKLAEQDAQKSRIVELRYFGGLSTEETAEVLGVSDRTIKRAWALARAWLRRELERGSGA
jgi:RNA polymerase sigma-70 factor, ECF subfamily